MKGPTIRYDGAATPTRMRKRSISRVRPPSSGSRAKAQLAAKSLGIWPRIAPDAARPAGISELGSNVLAAWLSTTSVSVNRTSVGRLRPSRRRNRHGRDRHHIADLELPPARHDGAPALHIHPVGGVPTGPPKPTGPAMARRPRAARRWWSAGDDVPSGSGQIDRRAGPSPPRPGHSPGPPQRTSEPTVTPTEVPMTVPAISDAHTPGWFTSTAPGASRSPSPRRGCGAPTST